MLKYAVLTPSDTKLQFYRFSEGNIAGRNQNLLLKNLDSPYRVECALQCFKI